MKNKNMRFEQVLISLKALLLCLIVEFIYYLPSSSLKFRIVGNMVRYKLYNSKYSSKLFASFGETVIHAGIWRIETILFWLEAVGQQGKLIVIEADSNNYQILEYEIQRRRLDNVTIINKAVMNFQGVAKLQVSKISKKNQMKEMQAYNYFNDDKDYSNELDVEVDRLDEIADLLDKRIDMVFMSISGAEIEALEGMPKLLSRGCKLYIVSLSAENKENTTLAYEKAVEILKKYNYKIYLSPQVKAFRGARNIFAYKK